LLPVKTLSTDFTSRQLKVRRNTLLGRDGSIAGESIIIDAGFDEKCRLLKTYSGSKIDMSRNHARMDTSIVESLE
jgi:hypothetical protein